MDWPKGHGHPISQSGFIHEIIVIFFFSANMYCISYRCAKCIRVGVQRMVKAVLRVMF